MKQRTKQKLSKLTSLFLTLMMLFSISVNAFALDFGELVELLVIMNGASSKIDAIHPECMQHTHAHTTILSSQSRQPMFTVRVALTDIPQQGQTYLRVLLGLVVGVMPVPLFAPPTGTRTP